MVNYLRAVFSAVLIGLPAVSAKVSVASDLPDTSNDRLGIRVTRHYFAAQFGNAKPVGTDNRLMVLDLQLVNRVTADLVFEKGFPESLSLPLNKFQLLWNGQSVEAGATHLAGQPGHLPDPTGLNYAGARDDGQVVFEVPGEEPSSLTLIFRDASIGNLDIQLIGDAPPDTAEPARSGELVKYPKLPPPDPPSRHDRLSAETQGRLDDLAKLPAPTASTVPHNQIRTIRPGDTISEKLDGETRRINYALEISEENASSLHEIAITHSKSAVSFELADSDGNLMLRGGGKQQISVSDLGFEAGSYSLEVTAPKKEDHFHLTVIQTGPRQAGIEFEPNDKHDQQQLPKFSRLPEGHWEVTGRLIESDTDCYALEIPEGKFLATVELHAKNTATLSHLINGASHASERGKTASVEYLYVTEGRHIFSVEGKDTDYILRAFVTPVPDPFFEQEPNANFGQAKLITFNQSYRGIVSKRNDQDWFRFKLPGTRQIRISAQAPATGNLSIQLERRGLTQFDQRVAAGQSLNETIDLSSGSYGVLIKSTKRQQEPYSFKITPVPLAAEIATSNQLVLSWNSELQAAAYHSGPQQISGTLEIIGPEAAELEAMTSNDNVNLIVGEVVANRASVTLKIDANTPSDDAVEIVIVAEATGGSKAHKTSDRLVILPTNPPTAESWFDAPLPKELLGNFNIAAKEFGAVPVIPDGLSKRDADQLSNKTLALIDGFNSRGKTFITSAGKPIQPVIALPGNSAWPLAGTILKLDSSKDLGDGLREFSIEASQDGKQFIEFFAGKLEPGYQPQAFVFAAPTRARFVRLKPKDVQRENKRGSLALAEWKLIVAHQKPPINRMDIGSEALGGHIVYENEEKTTRVTAFHHNRCAQIESIFWRNDPNHKLGRSNTNPITLNVSVSTETPFGPWRKLGAAKLNPASENIEMRMPPDTWARFVKFDIPAPPEGKRYARAHPLPGAIEIGKGSILAEWGAYRRDAVYERLHKPEDASIKLVRSGGLDRQNAAPLVADQPVNGSVWIDEGRESWYRVTTPEGDSNHLACKLSGERYVKAALEAFDADGHPIQITSIERGDGSHTWYAPVRPGQEIFLRIYEPQRSYLFLWDDSGSMKAYVPRIHAALSSFCSELDPFTERVQLLPFSGSPDGGFLLKDWGVNPHEMQGMLRGYGLRSSSAAHDNLVSALKLLEPIPGNRAIVIITDAEANEAPKVLAEEWELLHRLRAPVFGFHTLGSAHHVDVVQDWAEAGGGAYYPVDSLDQLEAAFQHAKAALRRPTDFNLLVSGAHLQEPPPGGLTVVSPPNRSGKIAGIGSNDAVEIILDASGSMLKTMGDGRKRIEVARSVLLDLISNTLPEKTNFALRVFGHREAGSCRTDLEIPLAPLEKTSALNSIRAINAINLAKTPIAASLEAVSEDLAGTSGRRLVLLVTDGKETCEGDPRDAVGRLVSDKFDVRVNIIGFAIRDLNLKRQFEEWAGIGNGDYFDAADAQGLKDSIEASLRPHFEIIDAGDKVVGAGRVDGESINLRPGHYKVRIAADSNQDHEIEIQSGKMTTIKMLE